MNDSTGSGAPRRAERVALAFTVLFLVSVVLSGAESDVDRAVGPTTIGAVMGPESPPPPGSTGPDQAWRRQQAIRAPADPGLDVRAAYRAAVTAARRLPRHSVRLGGFVGHRGAEVAGADRAAEPLGVWEPLGPGNIGGRTRVLTIDPDRPRTRYAGGVSGGVWRTRNGGKRWEAIGEDLANLTINSMAMDPRDPETLIVGTGEGYFREEVRGTGLPLRGDGIFRTRDGGDSWERLASTDDEDFHWVNDLVYSPHDSDRFYAATRSGVWRTADDGASWERILAPEVKGGCLDLEIRNDASGDTLFASCGSFEQATVWRSLDAAGAASFEAVLSDAGMGRTEIALAPSDQDVIYALAASNVPGPGGNYEQALHGVFASTAGGEAGTWEARVRNTDPDKLNTVLLHHAIGAMASDCGGSAFFLPMGWYSSVLAVDPVNPERLFAGSVYVLRSDDGGRDWGMVTGRAQSPIHVDHHGLVFDPRYDGARNRKLYFLNDGGIYRTDDALAEAPRFPEMCNFGSSRYAFESLNNGYQVTQFYHGVPFPGGASYLGGTQDNGTVLGRDNDGPDGWDRIFGGDGSYAAIDPVDPDVIYVQAQNAFVRKTTDGGDSFVLADRGLEPPTIDFLGTDTNYVFITPLFMDPSNRLRLWLGGERMWRTDDGADLWQAASRDLKKKDKVTAISIAPSDPDRVVAGVDSGRLYRTERGTTAGGATRWPSKRPRKGWVTWIAHDPTDPDIVYATYGNFGGKHVYRSRNGGKRWRPIDGNGPGALPDIPVHAIVVDPSDTDRLFLATDLGVFVSPDGGDTWAVENTGFGAIVTESLSRIEDFEGNDWLFAFTHGRGAWRAPLNGGASGQAR